MGKDRNQGQWSFIHCDVACPSAPTGGLFNTWRLFDKVDKSFQNKRPQNQIGVTWKQEVQVAVGSCRTVFTVRYNFVVPSFFTSLHVKIGLNRSWYRLILRLYFVETDLVVSSPEVVVGSPGKSGKESPRSVTTKSLLSGDWTLKGGDRQEEEAKGCC